MEGWSLCWQHQSWTQELACPSVLYQKAAQHFRLALHLLQLSPCLTSMPPTLQWGSHLSSSSSVANPKSMITPPIVYLMTNMTRELALDKGRSHRWWWHQISSPGHHVWNCSHQRWWRVRAPRWHQECWELQTWSHHETVPATSHSSYQPELKLTNPPPVQPRVMPTPYDVVVEDTGTTGDWDRLHHGCEWGWCWPEFKLRK